MSKKIENFSNVSYLQSAIIQREVINRLMQRLSLINFSPRSIIDIGSGIGLGTENLLKFYSKTKFYMLDNSFKSLKDSVIKQKKVFPICANFTNIPFNDYSFDFVFSSSALHWDLDIQMSFSEIYRILKPGGLFLFATYGPDTLIELRSAWSIVDKKKHVNDFYEMHDIGDLMLNLNFMDPVVDVEKIVVEYINVKQLQKDLKNIGSKVIHEEHHKNGLFGTKKMKDMYEEYEKFRRKNGTLPATYEVIYGSAWKKMDNISEYIK